MERRHLLRRPKAVDPEMASSLAQLLSARLPRLIQPRNSKVKFSTLCTAPGQLALALQRKVGCPDAGKERFGQTAADPASSNLALVRDAYRLTFDSTRPDATARSIEGFLDLLAPDAEFVTGSGIRAPRQGEQPIRGLLFEAAEQWQECSFAIAELLELDARHVLVCGMAFARSLGQGEKQEIPFVNLWTFEGERAVRIESFVDRRQALAALDSASD
jgi:ketosteroid isomerase-like protein